MHKNSISALILCNQIDISPEYYSRRFSMGSTWIELAIKRLFKQAVDNIVVVCSQETFPSLAYLQASGVRVVLQPRVTYSSYYNSRRLTNVYSSKTTWADIDLGAVYHIAKQIDSTHFIVDTGYGFLWDTNNLEARIMRWTRAGIETAWIQSSLGKTGIYFTRNFLFGQIFAKDNARHPFLGMKVNGPRIPTLEHINTSADFRPYTYETYKLFCRALENNPDLNWGDFTESLHSTESSRRDRHPFHLRTLEELDSLSNTDQTVPQSVIIDACHPNFHDLLQTAHQKQFHIVIDFDASVSYEGIREHDLRKAQVIQLRIHHHLSGAVHGLISKLSAFAQESQLLFGLIVHGSCTQSYNAYVSLKLHLVKSIVVPSGSDNPKQPFIHFLKVGSSR